MKEGGLWIPRTIICC